MVIKSSTIQIRIDSKTKNSAKKIFEGIGLDMSSAIKLFLKQTVNLRAFPFELRDENGFSLKKAKIMRKAIKEVKENKNRKGYKNADEFIKSVLED